MMLPVGIYVQKTEQKTITDYKRCCCIGLFSVVSCSIFAAGVDPCPEFLLDPLAYKVRCKTTAKTKE